MTPKEKCLGAAIKMPNLCLITGHRHDDCIRAAVKAGYSRDEIARSVQGFMTDSARFVDRKEGMVIQRASGIPSNMNPNGIYVGSDLFSEDLY